MKKTFITQEQLNVVNRTYKSLRGTPRWGDYVMRYDVLHNGHWVCIGYDLPLKADGFYFKTIRGNLYIYNDERCARFFVDDQVKNLLGL